MNFALSLFAMLKIIQTNTYGFQISFFSAEVVIQKICIATVFISLLAMKVYIVSVSNENKAKIISGIFFNEIQSLGNSI